MSRRFPALSKRTVALVVLAGVGLIAVSLTIVSARLRNIGARAEIEVPTQPPPAGDTRSISAGQVGLTPEGAVPSNNPSLQAELPRVAMESPAPLGIGSASRAPTKILVGAVTSDGEPFVEALLREWPDAPSPGVVASQKPLPQRIPWTTWDRWGAGRFERRPEGVPPELPGHIGWLTVTELPMYVGLHLDHNVLATLTIESATPALRFVLPSGSLHDLTGVVRGRVVPAAGEATITAGAMVDLERSGYFAPLGGKQLVDVEGRFHFDQVLFGTSFLRVGAPGSERLVLELDVPRGRELDLGDVALGKGRPLRGRAILPDGSAAAGARLEIGPEAAGQRLIDSPLALSSDRADDDGRFSLGPLGRRRYRLSASLGEPWSDGRHVARLLLDADQPDLAELEVTLQPSVPVSLMGVKVVADGSELSIIDAAGLVVLCFGSEELVSGEVGEPFVVQLVEGRHTIRLAQPGRAVRTRTLDVGSDPISVELP